MGSFENSTIVRINPTTGSQAVVTSGGMLQGPVDVIFGPDGQLYVASFGNRSVVRINPTTGAQAVVAAVHR